jgi:hypothetical protein
VICFLDALCMVTDSEREALTSPATSLIEIEVISQHSPEGLVILLDYVQTHKERFWSFMERNEG